MHTHCFAGSHLMFSHCTHRSYVRSTAVCVCVHVCMYACVSVCECAMFMNVPVFPDTVYVRT